jgi:hypothetical protein
MAFLDVKKRKGQFLEAPFFCFAASVLFVSFTALAVAATQPTPVINQPVKPPKTNPLLYQVNIAMKQQMRKIGEDQKGGKLTVDQAKTLRNNLKTIRKQVANYFKSNPNRELTADQAAQINQQLQTNSQSIP